MATFCNNIANGLPITVNDPAVRLELLYIDDLGQKLQHKMPSFQQVRLCMKREGKKEDNEEAIERRAHGLLLESSLSLQVVKQNSVGILVRGVP